MNTKVQPREGGEGEVFHGEAMEDEAAVSRSTPSRRAHRGAGALPRASRIWSAPPGAPSEHASWRRESHRVTVTCASRSQSKGRGQGRGRVGRHLQVGAPNVNASRGKAMDLNSDSLATRPSQTNCASVPGAMFLPRRCGVVPEDRGGHEQTAIDHINHAHDQVAGHDLDDGSAGHIDTGQHIERRVGHVPPDLVRAVERHRPVAKAVLEGRQRIQEGQPVVVDLHAAIESGDVLQRALGDEVGEELSGRPAAPACGR